MLVLSFYERKKRTLYCSLKRVVVSASKVCFFSSKYGPNFSYNS
jgi:hypothetical protein